MICILRERRRGKNGNHELRGEPRGRIRERDIWSGSNNGGSERGEGRKGHRERGTLREELVDRDRCLEGDKVSAKSLKRRRRVSLALRSPASSQNFTLLTFIIIFLSSCWAAFIFPCRHFAL